jgi:hypothetical protein
VENHSYGSLLRSLFESAIQNVAAEWLALLIPILEVLSSNLGPRDRLSSLSFRGFPSFLYANAGMLPLIWLRPLPSRSFPIHYRSCHSTLYSLLISSLNKPQINKRIGDLPATSSTDYAKHLAVPLFCELNSANVCRYNRRVYFRCKGNSHKVQRIQVVEVVGNFCKRSVNSC